MSKYPKHFYIDFYSYFDKLIVDQIEFFLHGDHYIDVEAGRGKEWIEKMKWVQKTLSKTDNDIDMPEAYENILNKHLPFDDDDAWVKNEKGNWSLTPHKTTEEEERLGEEARIEYEEEIRKLESEQNEARVYFATQVKYFWT